VTTEAWWFSSTGSRPAVSSLSEKAETWKAVEADSYGVLRKLPPRASAGAKAMAWQDAVDRRPSGRPARR
jgi:hypothetical protein